MLLANNYRILNNYDSSLYYLDNIEFEINKLSKNDHYYKGMMAEIFSWKGLVYFDLGNTEKAITYNMKAIDIRKIMHQSGYKIANGDMQPVDLHYEHED